MMDWKIGCKSDNISNWHWSSSIIEIPNGTRKKRLRSVWLNVHSYSLPNTPIIWEMAFLCTLTYMGIMQNVRKIWIYKNSGALRKYEKK